MVARRGQRAPRNAHGQHFLKSSLLVRRLIAGAAVSERDLVLDLGAGLGVITKELVRTGARVKAVELDPGLAEYLKKRFAATSNVEVVFEDILTLALPSELFKIVANLPFSSTTAMLRRLLVPESHLEVAQMIVQRGAAMKRTRTRGNLMNALAGPWFKLVMGGRIPRECFSPPPSVESAVLTISKRRPGLLETDERIGYEQLVTLAFKFAQLPITQSVAQAYGRSQVRNAVRDLGLDGDTALDLTVEEWTRLFTTLSR